ncbi:MAG: hypothetical protein AB7O46_02580 [Xanthobacteraceae bacterium]
MLLYFFAVAAAMFFGILAALIPGRKPAEKGPEKPETFEEIIAAQEKTAAPAAAVSVVAAPVVATAAAAAALSVEASAASVPASASVEAKADEPQPTPIDMEKSESISEAAVMDAVRAAVSGENNSAAKSDEPAQDEVRADKSEGEKSADEKPEEKAAAPDSPAAAETVEAKAPPAENVEVVAADVEPEPAAQAASLEDVRAAFESVERDLASAPQAVAAPQTVPEPSPEPVSGVEAVYEPETLAAAEAISAGLSANPSGVRKPFEGTVEELVERFRQLRLIDGTNSVAQAQRLLDESTLGALSKGIDPKQHLSDVAHLVLAEDPDLKSSVVRGVVVHIASRLKELGVAQRQPARSA